MNERNYSVSGKDRKALVNKVAELTGEKPVYLGMPTVAFKIGSFEISRNGILSWEDWAGESAEKLIKDLRNAGFRAEGDEETVANETEQTDLPEEAERREALMEQTKPDEPDSAASEKVKTSELDSPQNAEEIPESTPVNDEESTGCPPKATDAAQAVPEGLEIADPKDTPVESEAPESADHLTISLPDKLSDSQFLLLQRLVEGKETLFKHAFRVDSLEVIRADGKISFPWFKAADPDHTEAYTTFLTHLIKMAKNAKRVVVRDKPVDNEKFSFRVFMIRLGMIGDEYKQARKILMENLTGNSAWRNGAPAKEPAVESAKPGKVETVRV